MFAFNTTPYFYNHFINFKIIFFLALHRLHTFTNLPSLTAFQYPEEPPRLWTGGSLPTLDSNNISHSLIKCNETHFVLGFHRKYISFVHLLKKLVCGFFSCLFLWLLGVLSSWIIVYSHRFNIYKIPFNQLLAIHITVISIYVKIHGLKIHLLKMWQICIFCWFEMARSSCNLYLIKNVFNRCYRCILLYNIRILGNEFIMQSHMTWISRIILEACRNVFSQLYVFLWQILCENILQSSVNSKWKYGIPGSAKTHISFKNRVLSHTLDRNVPKPANETTFFPLLLFCFHVPGSLQGSFPIYWKPDQQKGFFWRGEGVFVPTYLLG